MHIVKKLLIISLKFTQILLDCKDQNNVTGLGHLFPFIFKLSNKWKYKTA